MDSTNNERAAEQWLDSALNDFSKAEPRAGLEKRVLANLEAQRSLAASHRWWWIAGIAAASALILVVLGLGRSGRPAKSTNTTVASHGSDNSIQTIINEPRGVQKALRARSAPAPGGKTYTAANDTPKLAQFPAPRQLSPEDLRLLSYVQKNPGAVASALSLVQEGAADLHVSRMDIKPLAIENLAGTESENN